MRITAFALVVAGCALAQSQDASFKGVVRLNRAPVSNEVLRVKFPRAVEMKLSNGLTLLVVESTRTPTVELDLVLPASTISDPEGLAGVADCAADMIRQGTKTRNARQIAERAEELGARLNSRAGFGSRTTHVTLDVLSENIDPALELFADVLLRPSFPQDELDKWKQRQLGFLQQARSQPGFLAQERMMRLLYDDARAVIAPTPDQIKKVTREHLTAFYQAYYRPSNAILGIAGDVKAKAIAAKLEKALAGWAAATVEQPKLSYHPPAAQKRIVLINRPNSAQSYLMVANRAIDRRHPDYFSCIVMNRVLGQGPAARLFRNLREDKGYTYGIGSNFTALHYMHHFAASTSVRTEVTGPALEELLREFRDVRERAIPTDELEGAQRALVANFALAIENTSNVLNNLLLAKEYGFPPDYFDHYPEKIMAVTQAQAREAANKYVPVDNAQVVVVGDAAKVRSVLAAFGTVEEYTAEGERVASSGGAGGR